MKGGTKEAEERRSEGHRDVKVGTETGGGNKRGWGMGVAGEMVGGWGIGGSR